MIKDAAREVIDILVQLDSLSKDQEPAEVWRQIERAASFRQKLNQAARQLTNYAIEQGVAERPALLQTIDIRHYQRLLTNNWPAFRQLILATWPTNQRPADAVARLDRLLPRPRPNGL